MSDNTAYPSTIKQSLHKSNNLILSYFDRLLISCGFYWSLVVSGGLYWSPVISAGLYWTPVVSSDLSWSSIISASLTEFARLVVSAGLR